MAEPVIITWTPANWITVGLMVLLPYFLLGAAVKIMEERQKAA
jgi:hypothetical protein